MATARRLQGDLARALPLAERCTNRRGSASLECQIVTTR